MNIKLIKIIPMFLALVLLSNMYAQDKKGQDEVQEESMAIIILNDASDNDLKKITKEFSKEGITLKIDKVKRNAEGIITGISVNAKRKTKGNSSSSSYSNSGDTPLSPIEISFNSKGGLTINSGEKASMHSSEGNGGTYVFISDDGKKKKLKKKIKIKKEGKEKKDGEESVNVWVTSTGDKTTTKTVVYSTSDEFEESGEHGKTKKTIKISKSGDKHVFISGDDDDSIIKVNGKVVTKEELEKMDKDEIKTIEIESEGHSDNDEDASETVIRLRTPGQAPMYMVDGKEVKSIEHIKPDNIATMHVLKGESALAKYGAKGKDGVIEIITKK